MEFESIVKEISEDRKVLAIVLFGSAAKGKTKPMSDIDLAIVLEPYDFSSAASAEAKSSRTMDIVAFNDLPLFIQFEVMRDGKVLYCRDDERLRQVFLKSIKDYHFHVPLYEKFAVI